MQIPGASACAKALFKKELDVSPKMIAPLKLYDIGKGV